ncbi:MAG: hypothetical protein KAI17_07580 [Thiotrichaceae bacterium]|nr:hypothetical protein [Thiotrichaceae bacterium]
MIDTGKAIIKTYGDIKDNVVNIDIYFAGELSDTDMNNIYHTIIREYKTPVNILCTRHKENMYSIDAAAYMKINSKHVFNKIACIADDPVTIESFNSSRESLFKDNQTNLFKTMDEGYHWLIN